MALQFYTIVFPQGFFSARKPKQNLAQMVKHNNIQHPLKCCSAKKKVSHADSDLAIYQPTNWSHTFIDSLDTNLPSKLLEKEKELEKKVRALNVDYEDGTFNALLLLEHIDDIERLGLGYRFQDDIRRSLNIIASINEINIGHEGKDGSLHAESLRFTLLRKHGYNVSQDFLRRFKDSNGGFIKCLQTDVKGLLSLYEASYLSLECERDLQEAKLFATEHLLKLKSQENEALHDINHALELPLYRTMLRLQARWYIDAYGKRKDADQLLLQLAKLDFNMVQSEYKKELQEVSRWWNKIGLASKLSLVRDRLMECFFWVVGVVFEPQYYSCRIELTKVGTLITVIDDIYDVYGSLDELRIFTDAVKRWDRVTLQHMPGYLQLGFRALYNTINDMGSDTWTGQGEHIMPVLVKVWGELLEAFYVEANWTHNKYIPTLQDYLDNAWRSVSGVVILTHGYFLINQEVKKDVVESLEKYHDLFKWSSMIFRLRNDLATSSNEIQRGKTANAISCYMHEKGVGEAVAREYIKSLIDDAWRKLNKARLICSQEYSTDPVVDMAINLARISECVYQYGDGHGAPDARAKDRVLSVIIEPIPIKETKI